MANKDKILLLAMISMLLPGALPDAMADSNIEPETKPAKRAAHTPTKPIEQALSKSSDRARK